MRLIKVCSKFSAGWMDGQSVKQWSIVPFSPHHPHIGEMLSLQRWRTGREGRTLWSNLNWVSPSFFDVGSLYINIQFIGCSSLIIPRRCQCVAVVVSREFIWRLRISYIAFAERICPLRSGGKVNVTGSAVDVAMVWRRSGDAISPDESNREGHLLRSTRWKFLRWRVIRRRDGRRKFDGGNVMSCDVRQLPSDSLMRDRV